VPFPSSLRTAECRAFAEYYMRIRGAETVAARTAFDPGAIRALLPHLLILERRAPDVLWVRLAGTRYRTGLGREVTGRNWLELAPPPMRAAQAKTFGLVVEQPCGLHAVVPRMLPDGQAQNFEFVAFPLLPDRPDLPPQLVCAGRALDEVSGRDMGPDGTVSAPLSLQFFDLGAGVPRVASG